MGNLWEGKDGEVIDKYKLKILFLTDWKDELLYWKILLSDAGNSVPGAKRAIKTFKEYLEEKYNVKITRLMRSVLFSDEIEKIVQAIDTEKIQDLSKQIGGVKQDKSKKQENGNDNVEQVKTDKLIRIDDVESIGKEEVKRIAIALWNEIRKNTLKDYDNEKGKCYKYYIEFPEDSLQWYLHRRHILQMLRNKYGNFSVIPSAYKNTIITAWSIGVDEINDTMRRNYPNLTKSAVLSKKVENFINFFDGLVGGELR